MNILKKAAKFLGKLFRRKPTEKEIDAVVDRVWDEDKKQQQVKEVIHDIDDNDEKNRIIDRITEMDKTIKILERKKSEISVILGSISMIDVADTSQIDASLKKIQAISQKKIRKSKFNTKIVAVKDFESFLNKNSLLKQFRELEIARKQRAELHKKQVNEKLTKIETLVNQGKLDEAKLLITQIQKEIKKDYTHELERLSKSIQKFKEKEFAILKRRQEEKQKRREEETERLREEQKKREQVEKEKRESEERERNAKLEQQRQERARLEKLLKKKPNWQEFQQILQQNGITTLYHFTDRANIRSIKENGGLFSWHYCDVNDIEIPLPGGGSLSRDLDRRYSLQDYVRVSFTRNHPMMYVARNEGRIQNPVILEISLDVCSFVQTRFANMNATRNGHHQGQNLDDLNRIHFRTVKLPNHFDLDESEKPYFQAEVLVKTWIPIKYITNINNF
jgi:phenylpyruvate tautomerase PptA (4-oxalocrotonate tautomerase family)